MSAQVTTPFDHLDEMIGKASSEGGSWYANDGRLYFLAVTV
jgi:hypothetical protein